MKKKMTKVLLVLMMVQALLLCSCGEAAPVQEQAKPAGTEQEAEPEQNAEPEQPEEPAPAADPSIPEGAVLVSNVDELLAAIAPNTTIVLQAGEYDLSDAADYGAENQRGPYRWDLIYGGCELNIVDVTGLSLIGQGEVTILAKPRYAEVIRFTDCWNLHLEGLTLGHTQEAGPCSAGVMGLDNCEDVTVENCRLFGCGSMGVSARYCDSVFVRNTRIDSCSIGAVEANGCRDFRLEDCQLCDCGLSQEYDGFDLIYAERCKGFALVNCEISGNRMQRLFHNYWSDQMFLLGCKVEQNRILDTMFLLEGRSLTVDKCSFQRRSSEDYYSRYEPLYARSIDGEDLISFDLDHMELARAEYEGPQEVPEIQLDRTQLPDGSWEIHVSNVNELLAAIAPDTTIVLEAGDYDLTQAENYGGPGGDWYSWNSVYDGYGLMVMGVDDLQIVGAGKEETQILSEPRYAAVIGFQGCQNLRLADFTAGHTTAPGYCSGDVLDFENCWNVSIEGCGLFGCGVEGIYAWSCGDIAVRDSEIYACSYAAASFTYCSSVSFEGCSIHDNDEGNDRIFVTEGELIWDGEVIGSGMLKFGPDGFLGLEEPAW